MPTNLTSDLIATLPREFRVLAEAVVAAHSAKVHFAAMTAAAAARGAPNRTTPTEMPCIAEKDCGCPTCRVEHAADPATIERLLLALAEAQQTIREAATSDLQRWVSAVDPERGGEVKYRVGFDKSATAGGIDVWTLLESSESGIRILAQGTGEPPFLCGDALAEAQRDTARLDALEGRTSAYCTPQGHRWLEIACGSTYIQKLRDLADSIIAQTVAAQHKEE